MAEVQVSGLTDQLDTDYLILYFESRRHSGGGPVESFTRTGTEAFLTYINPSDAEKVLLRAEHQVCGVSVRVRRSPPWDPGKVVFQGLKPNIEDSMLRLYMENMSEQENFSTTFSTDRTTALVTFQEALSDTDFYSMMQRVKARGLQGATVSVQRVRESSKVLVHNVAPHISSELLEMYFENRRSGGGRVHSLTMHGTMAIVCFEEKDAAENVLKRTHTIQSSELHLSPYHPELLGPVPDADTTVLDAPHSTEQPGELSVENIGGEEQCTEMGQREDCGGRQREDCSGGQREDSGGGQREDCGGGQREHCDGGQRDNCGGGQREDCGGGQREDCGGGQREDCGGGQSEDCCGGQREANSLRSREQHSQGHIIVATGAQKGVQRPEQLGVQRSVMITSVNAEHDKRHPGNQVESAAHDCTQSPDSPVTLAKLRSLRESVANMTEMEVWMEPAELRFLQEQDHELLVSMDQVTILPLNVENNTGFKVKGNEAACQTAVELLHHIVCSLSSRPVPLEYPGIVRFLLCEDGQRLLRMVEQEYHCIIDTSWLSWKGLDSDLGRQSGSPPLGISSSGGRVGLILWDSVAREAEWVSSSGIQLLGRQWVSSSGIQYLGRQSGSSPLGFSSSGGRLGRQSGSPSLGFSSSGGSGSPPLGFSSSGGRVGLLLGRQRGSHPLGFSSLGGRVGLRLWDSVAREAEWVSSSGGREGLILWDSVAREAEWVSSSGISSSGGRVGVILWDSVAREAKWVSSSGIQNADPWSLVKDVVPMELSSAHTAVHEEEQILANVIADTDMKDIKVLAYLLKDLEHENDIPNEGLQAGITLNIPLQDASIDNEESSGETTDAPELDHLDQAYKISRDEYQDRELDEEAQLLLAIQRSMDIQQISTEDEERELQRALEMSLQEQVMKEPEETLKRALEMSLQEQNFEEKEETVQRALVMSYQDQWTQDIEDTSISDRRVRVSYCEDKDRTRDSTRLRVFAGDETELVVACAALRKAITGELSTETLEDVQSLHVQHSAILSALEQKHGVQISVCEGQLHVQGIAQAPYLCRQELAQILSYLKEKNTVGESHMGVELISLQETCQEYDDVVQMFYSTLQDLKNVIQVLEIRKVKNVLLRNQYELKKQSMLLHKSREPVEQILYHGTTETSAMEICHHGFNRSFCGKNATLYGQGVYFATDAVLSTRDNYSPPSKQGKKFVLVAQVLTGEFTLGKPDMRTPPLLEKSGEVPRRYDTLVDCLSKPSIYVIFNDTQAYPKYLITCCKSG
ncbi:protein mono-ADP-ribosyltransferase PARP10 [Pelodytes ibericus]